MPLGNTPNGVGEEKAATRYFHFISIFFFFLFFAPFYLFLSLLLLPFIFPSSSFSPFPFHPFPSSSSPPFPFHIHFFFFFIVIIHFHPLTRDPHTHEATRKTISSIFPATGHWTIRTTTKHALWRFSHAITKAYDRRWMTYSEWQPGDDRYAGQGKGMTAASEWQVSAQGRRLVWWDLGGVSVTGESRDTKFLIRRVTIRGDIAGRLRERRGLGWKKREV